MEKGKKHSMKKRIAAAVLAVFLAGGILLGYGIIKPAARPEAAETDEAFQRVLADVGEITKVPHPAGSTENEEVRRLIEARGASLGLKAQVQPFTLDVQAEIAERTRQYEEDSAVREGMDRQMQERGYTTVEELVRAKLGAHTQTVLTLNNLLFRLEGERPENAVMFVSHYDSVGGAPGAGDDGLAVACMLELMKTLTAGEKPRNDVYFLFTDGEEQGLLGAAHFVKAYPEYVEKTDVLFNFEARGNAGALLMFETSKINAVLLRLFDRAAEQPVTTSLATAIYEQMPNGTDFSPLKEAGYRGLNFAMIEGDEHYHQPTDTLDNLNKDTAWQYYRTVSGLGAYFSGTDLDSSLTNGTAIASDDMVYFSIPWLGVVLIPGPMANVLGFLPLALAIALLCLDVMKKSLKPLRTAGLLLMGLIPAAATVLFLPGSYLFSIPAILFLGLEVTLTVGFGRRSQIGALVGLAVTLFVLGILYLPIICLIHTALKLWAVTAVLAAIPLAPAVLYSVKTVRRL